MSARVLASLPADDRLRAVVRGGLHAHGWAGRQGAPGGAPWDADAYGLSRVDGYVQAQPATQSAVLQRCAADQLEEALHIENIGMAYAAHMLLGSDTIEERQLYATIAADEALHHAALTPFVPRFVPRPEAASTDAPAPFLSLLERLVVEGDRATRILVVQVVLEGWGMEHYRGLARRCADPTLAAVLTRIVDDEARHHGSGVILAPRLPAGDAAVDVLTSFLDMVRVGPQAVLAALIGCVGPMSRPERITALSQLRTEDHAGAQLLLIRRLLEKAGATAIVAALHSRGRFRPLTAEEAA